METIDFSYNWNNKLNCKAFTTLRLSGRHNINDTVRIALNGAFHIHGTILAKKELKLDKINDFIAYLDTGYNAEECKNILIRMYSKKLVDWNTQIIYLYLIKAI